MSYIFREKTAGTDFAFYLPSSSISAEFQWTEQGGKCIVTTFKCREQTRAQLCQVRLREISNLHCNTLLRMKNSRQRLNRIMSTCISIQTQGKEERLQLSSAQVLPIVHIPFNMVKERRKKRYCYQYNVWSVNAFVNGSKLRLVLIFGQNRAHWQLDAPT